jgi:hypothetical protein
MKNTLRPSSSKRNLRDDPIDTTEENYDGEEEEEEEEEQEEELDSEEEQTSDHAHDSDASDTSEAVRAERKGRKGEPETPAPLEVVPPTLEELVSRPPQSLLPEHTAAKTAGDTPLTSHPFYRLTT